MDQQICQQRGCGYRVTIVNLGLSAEVWKSMASRSLFFIHIGILCQQYDVDAIMVFVRVIMLVTICYV